MKKLLGIFMLPAALFFLPGCEKENGSNASCNKPHTAAPTGMAGNWSSSYSSFTQVVDTYDGHYLGNAWQSGKFFHITNDGLGAEFYYMASSQYSQAATKATGSISFTAGSDAQSGSFTFHPCHAHYKGYGTSSIDRDATETELNNLTVTYYYMVEGDWLRIEPNGPVNDYSSSFRLVN